MPDMMGQQDSGMENKIRTAALSGLSPEELQYVGQVVTPVLVQIMAKLFGDVAVTLLQPLEGIDQYAGLMNEQAQAGMGGPLPGPSAMGQNENYPTPVQFGRPQ